MFLASSQRARIAWFLARVARGLAQATLMGVGLLVVLLALHIPLPNVPDAILPSRLHRLI